MENTLKEIKKFRDERDWMKFHNPKDMAISISIEASELLEHFQWKSEAEIGKHIENHRDEISDELADIGMYLLELSDNLGISLLEAIHTKLEKNKKRFPVE